MRKIAIGDMLYYFAARAQKKLRLNAIRGTHIHYTSKLESGTQIVNSIVGRHSFCGYDCTILNTEIGSFCSISDGVVIGGSEHPLEFVSTSPVFLSHRDSVKKKYAFHKFEKAPRVIIGNDVWIGRSALLKSGITIGHGSAVGMGAVVTKSFPPYSIIGGNPARLIRMRFSSEIIDCLLESKWWEWPDDRIAEFGEYFCDPQAFCKYWRGE